MFLVVELVEFPATKEIRQNYKNIHHLADNIHHLMHNICSLPDNIVCEGGCHGFA